MVKVPVQNEWTIKDTVGLQMLSKVMAAKEYDPAAAMGLADGWLTESAELGLGANDPDNMEIVEVNLG